MVEGKDTEMTTLQIVSINILSMVWFLMGSYFHIRSSRDLRGIIKLNSQIQEIQRKIQAGG